MSVISVVINGYYGMGNAGDEAVLACALEGIRKARPDASITVLSGDPEATSAMYGVSSTARKGIAALRAVALADFYVSGGGSLLQDVTSAASSLYYIGLMLIAKAAGTPYAIYANGVGPLRRGWVRWFAKAAVEAAAFVSVRDPGSMRLIRAIGVKRDDILMTSDPVFAIKPRGKDEVLSAVRETSGDDAARTLASKDGSVAIISLRRWPGLEEAFEGLSGMVRSLKTAGFTPIGLGFQPDEDIAALKDLGSYMKEDIPIISCGFHPEITAGIFSFAGLTVGMRLHSLIMSAAAEVPALGISYDPKVDALFEMLPLGRSVAVREVSGKGQDELKELIENLPRQKERLGATIQQVKGRAEASAGQMFAQLGRAR